MEERGTKAELDICQLSVSVPVSCCLALWIHMPIPKVLCHTVIIGRCDGIKSYWRPSADEEWLLRVLEAYIERPLSSPTLVSRIGHVRQSIRPLVPCQVALVVPSHCLPLFKSPAMRTLLSPEILQHPNTKEQEQRKRSFVMIPALQPRVFITDVPPSHSPSNPHHPRPFLPQFISTFSEPSSYLSNTNQLKWPPHPQHHHQQQQHQQHQQHQQPQQ